MLDSIMSTIVYIELAAAVVLTLLYPLRYAHVRSCEIEIAKGHKSFTLLQRLKGVIWLDEVLTESGVDRMTSGLLFWIVWYARRLRTIMRIVNRYREYSARRRGVDWDGAQLERYGFKKAPCGAWTRVVYEDDEDRIVHYVWLIGRPWICIMVDKKSAFMYEPYEYAFEVTNGTLEQGLRLFESKIEARPYSVRSHTQEYLFRMSPAYREMLLMTEPDKSTYLARMSAARIIEH